MPMVFPLRSLTLLYSGRATRKNSGRRKVTETTRSGAPRWIERIALPIEPSTSISPEIPAVIARLAGMRINSALSFCS